MKRILLLFALVLSGVAEAQPYQPPDPMADFNRMRDEQHRQFEETVRKNREEFDARVRKDDDAFERTGFIMFGGFLAIVLLISIVGGFEARRKRRERLETQQLASTPVEYVPMRTIESGGFDVGTIRIAVDGRASKFVQTELAAIMKQYDATTAEGRQRCLREVGIMLRRVRDSWIYGGADNEPMRPRQDTLAAFMRLVDDAKTRITHRKAESAPAGDGIGVILVSIVVAMRGELMTVTDLATGEDLRRALEAASHRAADELVGLEVVWEPREEGRSLSSVALEGSYRTSELHRLQGATAGKAFCAYCGGPFPIELVTCPHCGAPAREARAS